MFHNLQTGGGPVRRIVLALLVMGLGAAGGCAGHRAANDVGDVPLWSRTDTDSLSLDAFFALPAHDRAARRDAARAYREAARSAATNGSYIQALTIAAGLAPDDPDPWLDLAHVWRWTGDYLRAESCLDQATAAVRAWNEPAGDGTLDRARREAAAVRLTLQRAWLLYDRAEWRAGLDWALAASVLKPGDEEAWRIEGLLEGALGRHADAHQLAANLRRRDPASSDAVWILAVLDVGRGQLRTAFDQLVHQQTGQGTVAVLRPAREQAAACYRDMGAIAERVGEWSYARRWYAESAAALPLRRTREIAEVRAVRLGPPEGRIELPVWLAAGRYYVTGSLAAYAGLAQARYAAATTDAERETWAGAVVSATGVLMRRDEDATWALRARGLVFAGQGQADRGLADLQKAANQLQRLGTVDAEVEAALGHLLLLKEDHDQARDHLERAVARDPALPIAWSDLGLTEVMDGNREAATRAFDRALALDPTLVTAWYNRGLMHLHAGDFAAAEADLTEAARLAPENQDIARILQQLQAQRRRTGS